mmetsp:Transcript_2940/g.4525  ORF Transcript_2940/g.4525 Transcript_2940/m.4525 type:complete len:458 (-) Transcript_2940:474-1847(-)
MFIWFCFFLEHLAHRYSFVTWLLLSLKIADAVHPTWHPKYRVVLLENTNDYYLLTHGTARRCLENKTVQNLGFDLSQLDSISIKELNTYAKDDTVVPEIVEKGGDPDDLMRVAILKSRVILGDLVDYSKWIGSYVNPAIFKWKSDRLILVTGSNYGLAHSKHTQANHLEFRWLNNSLFPIDQSTVNGGNVLGIAVNEVDVIQHAFVGEDPRTIVYDENRFRVIFTNPFLAKSRLGMVEIALNNQTDVAEISMYVDAIHPTIDFHIRHKNWSPFIYKGETYLLQSINPMLVVHPTHQNHQEQQLEEENNISPDQRPQVYAEKTSHSEPIPLDWWDFGSLRGGTNAVLLPDLDLYLGFFHTKGQLKGNFMSTYFMGAYTFTAEPPFRMLSMSPYPIMPENLYTGKWSFQKVAKLDYIIFPTSLFVENNQTVFLSLGHQDVDGFLLRMDLQSLLNTLVPV